MSRTATEQEKKRIKELITEMMKILKDEKVDTALLSLQIAYICTAIEVGTSLTEAVEALSFNWKSLVEPTFSERKEMN